jgi:NAD-dependent histone deacetylase SIR2
MGNDGEPHKNKYEEIINLLKTNQLKNITFITGAGISTSAGIPDFRSSNGLFAQTQKKYNLSKSSSIFSN